MHAMCLSVHLSSNTLMPYSVHVCDSYEYGAPMCVCVCVCVHALSLHFVFRAMHLRTYRPLCAFADDRTLSLNLKLYNMHGACPV